MQISKKTEGLPFAIALVAGILVNAEKTVERWTEVLELLERTRIGGYGQDLSSIIGMSYQDLPDCLRHCFLYVGALPPDDEVLTSKLIKLWIAEGLIQQTKRKSLADVAMDYLMLLVGRGLIMVERRSSVGRVKSCRVNDLIHEFCLAKAKHENVYRLMDSYSKVSTLDGFDHRGADTNDTNIPCSVTCDHRRLFISSNWWDNISLEVSGPLVRSLVLTVRRSDFPRSHVSSLSHNFKLLRVLDLGRINVGNDFTAGLEKMTLLKYLEVRGEMTSIPPSIGSLQRLETFVTIGLRGEVAVPDAIWNLTKLKHLHIESRASFGAAHYKQQISGKLPNLRTMSTPLLRYGDDSEEMLRRLPSLEKLKCIFLESWDSSRKKNMFPRLGFLEHLHSLKLFYNGRVREECEFNFPSNLTRLTLSQFGLPWDQVSIIAQLPNLEVLKLQNNAFEGSHWEMDYRQFCRLKFLKLDTLDLLEWSIPDRRLIVRDLSPRLPLPCLERLELQNCKKLMELPPNLGYCERLKEIQLKYCSQFLQDSATRIKAEVSRNRERKIISPWSSSWLREIDLEREIERYILKKHFQSVDL